MQAELDKLLASRPNPTMLPAPIPAMLKSLTEEPQAGKFPDSLWRTLRAFNPKWLALFAIRASETGGSDGPGGFPQKLVLGACEQGGVETAQAVAAAVLPRSATGSRRRQPRRCSLTCSIATTCSSSAVRRRSLWR